MRHICRTIGKQAFQSPIYLDNSSCPPLVPTKTLYSKSNNTPYYFLLRFFQNVGQGLGISKLRYLGIEEVDTVVIGLYGSWRAESVRVRVGERSYYPLADDRLHTGGRVW